MALPNEPITRAEQYLAKIAGQDVDLPAEPVTRTEKYLAKIAKNGGGGGGSDNIFVATYGETSYADVLAAYNAGKTIVCKFGPSNGVDLQTAEMIKTALYNTTIFTAVFVAANLNFYTAVLSNQSGWAYNGPISVIKSTDMTATATRKASETGGTTDVCVDTDSPKSLFVRGLTVPTPDGVGKYLISSSSGLPSWVNGPDVNKQVIDMDADYPDINTAFGTTAQSFLMAALQSPGSITRVASSVQADSFVRFVNLKNQSKNVMANFSFGGGYLPANVLSASLGFVDFRLAFPYAVSGVGTYDIVVDCIITPASLSFTGYAVAISSD